MIHKVRALGIAFGALLAISAVVAPMASAEQGASQPVNRWRVEASETGESANRLTLFGSLF